MLEWTEKFATGHALIDSQHQLLIEYINQLEDIPRTTNPSRDELEFIFKFVDFVEDYTKAHFSHEEGCMARYRCPAHAENQAAHASFLDFFQGFKIHFETEGCRPELLDQLHHQCATWIQEHILQVDLKLKLCNNKTAKADESE